MNEAAARPDEEPRKEDLGSPNEERAAPADWALAELAADRIQRGGIRLLRLSRQAADKKTSRGHRQNIKVAMLAELRLLVKESASLEQAVPELRAPMDRYRSARLQLLPAEQRKEEAQAELPSSGPRLPGASIQLLGSGSVAPPWESREQREREQDKEAFAAVLVGMIREGNEKADVTLPVPTARAGCAE